MNAIILSIGDELILGQTVDTNSAWLSQQLAWVGCAVSAHLTIADDQAAIELAIRDSVPRCDFLIITGGIGPTADDLTRQALAAVMDVPLELNESWLARIHDMFRSRSRPMSPTNKIQAMIPRGAHMIDNTCGTAAGIHAQLATGNKQLATDVFVMPGVPKEMQAMFTRDVLPHVAERGRGAIILSRILHTFGLGESSVAELLGPLMDRSRNPSVGTTVSSGIVSLRLNSRFDNPTLARAQLDQTEAACRAALGDLIFGSDTETLPQIISRLLTGNWQLPTGNHPTVTTAESCTAGLLAKMLTDIPGSSAYFTHGWVTYSNAAKTQLLGVSPETLAQHGAVSESIVREMALGALARASATYALAISGIAGPDGGTPTKPVGTVCIALASAPARNTQHPALSTRTFYLFGDREMIRDRAAKMALTMLRYHLLGKPLPF